jgi:hypothetical protein
VERGIRRGCALSDVHAATAGATGLVSTDGPCILADSADELVDRANHFWNRMERPNMMLNLALIGGHFAGRGTMARNGDQSNAIPSWGADRYTDRQGEWTTQLGASVAARGS